MPEWGRGTSVGRSDVQSCTDMGLGAGNVATGCV